MKPKAKNAFKINADETSNNNKKIIFSDDESSNKKEKRNLFEDGDEDCDYDISQIKKSKRKVLGNDERFTIDKEYLNEKEEQEEDYEHEEPVQEQEDNLAHEKKKELEILGAILGKPILPKPENVPAKKASTMVRYDPTVDDHHKHEIKASKDETEPKKKSKKKKKEIEAEAEEKANEKPQLPPINQEIFYSVSDKLTESLQKKEEFSLLKTFGSAVPEVEQEEEKAKATDIQPLKVKYNIKTKNPFKYDSSDDEDGPQKNKKSNKFTNEFSGKFGQPKNFFFTINDSRFKDAEEFFKTTSTSDESFKNTRRELKHIVRSKIRNNVRRIRPWKTKVSRVRSTKKKV
ncbi:uncharacterized protein LOC141531038 [Cotesia typhae]